MSTSTVLMATLLLAVVGVVLIGGGIAYLVWDAKKERKAAASKVRRQAMQTTQGNPTFAPLPGSQANPSAGQTPKPSK